MGVRFEIDIERAAAGSAARLFERPHFRVLEPVVGINSLAGNHAARVNNHSAHVRVGGSQRDALSRQFQRAPQELLVIRVYGHDRCGGTLLEQRIHKFFRIEGQQVPYFFAHADKANGQTQFA